jgi:hypothetical protein
MSKSKGKLERLYIRRLMATNLLISSEWTIIKPQPPMVIKKRFQRISLELEDCRQNEDEDNLIFPDGAIINPESDIMVEISDEYGNRYRLESGQFGVSGYDAESETIKVNWAGFSNHPNDLPGNRRYREIRIRSEKPFHCSKIYWVDYDRK